METDNNKRKREIPAGQLSYEGPQLAEVPKKAPKLIGPAPPPRSVNACAPERAGDDSSNASNSDDEFGPTMPSSGSATLKGPKSDNRVFGNKEQENRDASVACSSSRSQRDSWMLTPPASTDWAARLDTTKIRSRKFQTGRSARSQPPSAGSDSVWTETPDQKIRRLHNEMMGVAEPAGDASRVTSQSTQGKIPESRPLAQNRDSRKAESLYKASQSATEAATKDDDPSARAFDREKDLALNPKMSAAQRREVVNKAADFGSRFTKGKFL